MDNITRRIFLKSAAAGAAALSLGACSRMSGPKTSAKVIGANGDIRVAVIGFHGQGGSHISTLSKMKGVRLVALCDVDQDVLDKGAQQLGGNVKTYNDMQKLFESKEIDAVSIATPNHWHALATVWACQAGKDVYVEKPACHNIFEGRKMVEAARRYGRIVQVGTQCRSSKGLQDAVKYVRDGNLGKIKIARGFCYKGRQSIGSVDGPQQVPANIDYNKWLGPALYELPRRGGDSRGPVHYNWHWFWAYGCGDYGNQGPHQVDICRWFLGEPEIAPFVWSAGGRLGYVDSAETPNTMVIYQGYKNAPLLFEVRGLPKDKASQKNGWDMDDYKGASIGCVIECEGGYVVVPSYTEAIVYDKEGKKVKSFTGKGEDSSMGSQKVASSGGHHPNWISCVRDRNYKNLNADILEGHISAGLVHTGNISFRLGLQKSPEEIKEEMKGNAQLSEATDRMMAHLEANGVDTKKELVQLGVPLKFDGKREHFTGNGARDIEANKMLTRPYRVPFVVPQKV